MFSIYYYRVIHTLKNALLTSLVIIDLNFVIAKGCSSIKFTSMILTLEKLYINFYNIRSYYNKKIYIKEK